MSRFIIEGSDLAKVIQENRIRIERGTIKFTKVDDAEDSKEVAAKFTKVDDAEDSKEVAAKDTKVVAGNDDKTPKQKK